MAGKWQDKWCVWQNIYEWDHHHQMVVFKFFQLWVPLHASRTWLCCRATISLSPSLSLPLAHRRRAATKENLELQFCVLHHHYKYHICIIISLSVYDLSSTAIRPHNSTTSHFPPVLHSYASLEGRRIMMLCCAQSSSTSCLLPLRREAAVASWPLMICEEGGGLGADCGLWTVDSIIIDDRWHLSKLYDYRYSNSEEGTRREEGKGRERRGRNGTQNFFDGRKGKGWGRIFVAANVILGKCLNENFDIAKLRQKWMSVVGIIEIL